MTVALVGLGSSLGDRKRSLSLAVQALDALPGTRVEAVARLYRTAPLGSARGWFLNSAVLLNTRMSARGLLGRCQEIERRLGRRPATRWSDRAIDLDLLLFGDEVRRGRALTLPHPGLSERAFALVPAREVARDLRHPVSGCRLGELPLPAGPQPVAVGTLTARSPARRAALARTAPLQYLHGSRTGSGSMKIFLDTANIDEIREACSWGIIDGVTTNPSLVAREGGDFVESIYEISEIVQGPVSAETVAQDAEGMIREGRLLARVSEHVVVKVPLTIEGLKATRVLSDDGISVNVTLCFQPAQALLAAKAGAAYVSPFLGRLDDVSTDGVGLIENIVRIFENYPELGTEVLAASIRHPLHVMQVALAGADVATVPFKVLKALVNHPLTTIGNERFLSDWAALPDNDIAAQVSRWLAKNQ